MPQEEQCPAITTEGGHLWASKDRSAQKDGKDQSEGTNKNSSNKHFVAVASLSINVA